MKQSGERSTFFKFRLNNAVRDNRSVSIPRKMHVGDLTRSHVSFGRCRFLCQKKAVRFVGQKTSSAFVVVLTGRLCFVCFSLQKWFKLRNAQWRQAEGLPAEVGSVLD